jgi:hypothetical protein
VRILLAQRGEHNIDLELSFSSHDGYVFHDSRGFEAGDDRELEIVQGFVRRRSQNKSLNDRLHAIWFVLLGIHTFTVPYSQSFLYRYCIPMDNDRPLLDIKHIDEICPDKNGMYVQTQLYEPGLT